MKASKFSDAQRAFIMKRGAAGVVDTFSRYAPVIDPRFSYRAEDVVATREQACAVLGDQEIGVVDGANLIPRLQFRRVDDAHVTQWSEGISDVIDVRHGPPLGSSARGLGSSGVVVLGIGTTLEQRDPGRRTCSRGR